MPDTALPSASRVSPEFVASAYRVLLGREPEDGAPISEFSALPSEDAVVARIMASPEYVRRFFSAENITGSPLVNFFHPHTVRMTARRQEHLALLNLPLHNRSVLEVGAGIGLHSFFFLDRGCIVHATDGRPENVRTMEALYRHGYGWYDKINNISFGQLDIEAESLPQELRRDVVYCYGLLYHVGNPQRAIQNLSYLCGDLLLLETGVAEDDAQQGYAPQSEDPANVSQAIHGHGSHPSRAYIFGELRNHFAHVYCAAIQPAHEMFPTDWSKAKRLERQNVRTVFVASRTALESPYLTKELPVHQAAP